MGTDIIFADRFGACRFDLLPLGGPDGQSALCKALAGAAQRTRVGGAVGQAKLDAKGLPDAQTRTTLHLNARQAVVVGRLVSVDLVGNTALIVPDED